MFTCPTNDLKFHTFFVSFSACLHSIPSLYLSLSSHTLHTHNVCLTVTQQTFFFAKLIRLEWRRKHLLSSLPLTLARSFRFSIRNYSFIHSARVCIHNFQSGQIFSFFSRSNNLFFRHLILRKKKVIGISCWLSSIFFILFLNISSANALSKNRSNFLCLHGEKLSRSHCRRCRRRRLVHVN